MKKVVFALAGLLAMAVLAFAFFYKANIPIETLKSKYANEHSQFMEIDGMQVHYRIEGEGPTLVLVHGTAASLHTWDGWTAQLQDSFRIIRMDIPAFGLTGSNTNNDYSMATYVDFLNQFLEKLGVNEFYLAGNSLGGNIAWNYTSNYPEKVKKLILVDASGFPLKKITSVFKIARNPAGAFLLKNILPKSFLEKNIKQVYFDDTKITESLIDRYYEMALREGNRDAFVARARTMLTQENPDLSNVTCPTLILWGEHDEWVPVENAYRFDSAIQDSKLIVYDNAGHVPMEEIPNVTANDVREFLSE